jgi:hypothetical protein
MANVVSPPHLAYSSQYSRWLGGEGEGGLVIKSACVGCPREHKILSLLWRGRGFEGEQYKMYNGIISINFISRSKKLKSKKVNVVYKAFVVSVS